MRILINKQVENFKFHREYLDSTFESNDGMRGGHSYSVDVDYSFFFENEQKEEKGWSYNLRVTKQTYGCYSYGDNKEVELDFEENFSFIATRLRNRGIFMLNFPAYKVAEGHLSRRTDGDRITVSFLGEVEMTTEDDEVITVDELFARVKEEVGESRTISKIARALTCGSLIKREFKVALESIPDELYGKETPVMLEEVTIDELLSSGEVSEADVANALEYLVARLEEPRVHDSIRIDGIEQIVTSLPDELRDKVLGYAVQTASCLKLRRAYCPSTIEWQYVKLEEYVESDLDLRIERGKTAYRDSEWAFLKQCLEKPELEQKIVDNVYVLGRFYIEELAAELKAHTTADLLRSVIAYGKANPGAIKVDSLSGLLKLEYEGLTQEDYYGYLEILGRCNGEKQAAFILKMGVSTGVAEAELVQMLEDAWGVCRFDNYMSEVYESLNFAPGLAWVQAEKDRREAEKQQLARKRAESSEKVVHYVQDSGKLAVGVMAGAYSLTSGYKILSLDGEEIGWLQSDEKRLFLIEGKGSHSYLINIERVKNLKNGILHLDVAEEDAGYIIGPKGAKIKETTEKLNELGCHLKMIKLHTH